MLPSAVVSLAERAHKNKQEQLKQERENIAHVNNMIR